MQKRKIEVVEYNEVWQALFLKEQRLLSQLLGSQAIAIEHIGSTSVPGLWAKPIIDILVEVKSFHYVDALEDDFAKLGFKAKGENGIEGRRYFQKGGMQRTHHLHVFELGHTDAFNHRIFRDYLNAHPDIALEYSGVKRQAALKCGQDMQVYMALKDDFIKAQLLKAKSWFEREL